MVFLRNQTARNMPGNREMVGRMLDAFSREVARCYEPARYEAVVRQALAADYDEAHLRAALVALRAKTAHYQGAAALRFSIIAGTRRTIGERGCLTREHGYPPLPLTGD